jgi:hypothetical protein
MRRSGGHGGRPEGLRYVCHGRPEGLRYVCHGRPEGLRYVYSLKAPVP